MNKKIDKLLELVIEHKSVEVSPATFVNALAAWHKFASLPSSNAFKDNARIHLVIKGSNAKLFTTLNNQDYVAKLPNDKLVIL